MSSAVIYCRVSSEEQANEGASLDAQQSISSDYATKQGWDIAGVFVERGVTGSTSEWGGLLWNPVIVELNQWNKALNENPELFKKEDSKAREQLNQPVSIRVQGESEMHRR